MQLLLGKLIATVSDDQIRPMVLAQLAGREFDGIIIPENVIVLPKFGEYWNGEGGVLTGLLPNRGDDSLYALITGPRIDDEARNYEDVKKKAEEIEVDGHKDFRLPYRAEQSLQMATIPELFKTDDWYWSLERPPANEFYADAQYFSDGRQDVFLTDDTCYGCAVRIKKIG